MGVAALVPAAAAAFTMIELLVVIAIAGESMGLLLPSQLAGDDCRRERTSVSVALTGDLEARLRIGRPDGSFDYHIRPVALSGSGAHEVSVRLVGAANGTATSGTPFDVTLRLIGTSDLGRINTAAHLSLVITPKPGDRTADARVLRVVADDPCDPRRESDDASSTSGTQLRPSTEPDGLGAAALGGTAAFGGAAIAGLVALTSPRRRRRRRVA